jgi:hypothetical protein
MERNIYIRFWMAGATATAPIGRLTILVQPNLEGTDQFLVNEDNNTPFHLADRRQVNALQAALASLYTHLEAVGYTGPTPGTVGTREGYKAFQEVLPLLDPTGETADLKDSATPPRWWTTWGIRPIG